MLDWTLLTQGKGFPWPSGKRIIPCAYKLLNIAMFIFVVCLFIGCAYFWWYTLYNLISSKYTMTLLNQVEVYNYSDFTSDDEHLIIDLSSNNQSSTETTLLDQASILHTAQDEEHTHMNDTEVVRSVLSQMISQVRNLKIS